MESEIIPKEKIDALSLENSRLVQRAQAIVIDSHEAYEGAGAFLLAVKAHSTGIKALFEKPKKDAFEAHRGVTNLEKTFLDPLTRAEGIVKPKLSEWNQEQERKRREEQEKAEAAARKIAEDEKIAQAAALEKAGDKVAAEQVMAEPLVISPVIRPVETPRVGGISYSTVWKCRVTDLKKLVDGIAAGTVPLAMVMADESALNKMAGAMKKLMAWPGVEAYSEQVVRGRR